LNDRYYIEVTCQQKSHHEARVCGDVFLSRRIKEEGRIIAVLSDGIGHGIKANLLATLASTLALKPLSSWLGSSWTPFRSIV
jgi:serine phosphatase RsbU (regulator of sigma subunit)